MSLFTKLAAFALLLLVVLQLVAADQQTPAATPEQLDAIKKTFLANLNAYRSVSGAAPLVWDDTLTGISDAQAMNCTLQYDVFNEGDRGQMVFKLGMEDGSFPDIVNGTWLAIEYWWDERKMYHPRSKDYDDLSKFSDTWEFTQMVWSSSQKIGCGWSYALCSVPADEQNIEGHLLKTTAQLVCNMVPAGNQWEQFGANVHCLADGCFSVEPQTNTINTATISWPSDMSKRDVPTRTASSAPAVTAGIYHYTEEELAAIQAEVEEVKKYRYMSPEEFIPGFIPNVQNKGKLMANAGHEDMISQGYDGKYFDQLHKSAVLDAIVH